jgi:hypothetical protein
MEYTIESLQSGVLLGTYHGNTPEEALDAMARAAGYRDAADARKSSGDDGSHLRVTLEQCAVAFDELCPSKR